MHDEDDDVVAADVEFYRELKAERQQKRASNRQLSVEILKARKIPFVTNNGGVHLIVCERFDFWPGTGLFIDRTTRERGRGVHNLLKRIQ